MKKLLFFLMLISVSMLANAQSDSSWRFKNKNIFTVELGSPSNIYTVNYERLLLSKKRLKTLIEIGAFYFPNQLKPYCTPLYVNQLFSIIRTWHLEIGLGSVFGSFQNFGLPLKYTNKFSQPVYFTHTPFSKIGLRYQTNDEKFVGKIGAILFLNRRYEYQEGYNNFAPNEKPIYFFDPGAYVALGLSF